LTDNSDGDDDAQSIVPAVAVTVRIITMMHRALAGKLNIFYLIDNRPNLVAFNTPWYLIFKNQSIVSAIAVYFIIHPPIRP